MLDLLFVTIHSQLNALQAIITIQSSTTILVTILTICRYRQCQFAAVKRRTIITTNHKAPDLHLASILRSWTSSSHRPLPRYYVAFHKTPCSLATQPSGIHGSNNLQHGNQCSTTLYFASPSGWVGCTSHCNTCPFL